MSLIARVLPQAAAGPIPRGIARTGPAILSYGFRPFFLGAGCWAVTAMSLWIGAIVWGWTPGGSYGALFWHGHEMLFGYTSAALAGFMLTAIPNWTGRLPVSGTPLLVLASVWLAGRLAMLMPDLIGTAPAAVIDALFFPLLGLIAAREIGAGQNWKNAHVVIALTVLTAANIWYHVSVITGGDTSPAYRLAIFVWIMLIALIGGRLGVSFTRNWLARSGETKLPASFGTFDKLAMLAALLALVSWIGFPDVIATGVLMLVAAALHIIRLWRWRGWRAWREPLVLVLHIAYAFIPLGLAALGAASFGLIAQVSALHLLTVGAIGNMTLAVMTRASRGHTGRPLKASRMTALAYACLVLAALVRPLVDLLPDLYVPVLSASASLWLAGFSFFLIEYAPMLITPRS